MKFGGMLLIVNDMGKAKEFYKNVMKQPVAFEMEEHVLFENGLGLQTNYEAIVGSELEIVRQSNSFQLYFEVSDVESWERKIQGIEGIDFLHSLKEYPWGQRSFRFYDFDKNIVEVSESMESVVIRFLGQGFTVEETSKKTMYPIEFVRQLQK